MSDTDTRLPFTRRRIATAVVFLLVVLAVWSYLRGSFGMLGGVVRGIRQVAPQAEERNRVVRELTNEAERTQASSFDGTRL